MLARAYCRCNSGHYFTGEHCPFDGWSSPASRELAAVAEQLNQQERVVSLEALRKAGASARTLARTIVVEFGCADSAFEAFSAREFVVNGEAKPPHLLSPAFK